MSGIRRDCVAKCESPPTQGHVKLLYIRETGTTFTVAESNSSTDLDTAANGIKKHFEGSLHSFNKVNQSPNNTTEFCNQIFSLPMVPILLSVIETTQTNQST
jgi:hypothetical protein